MPTRCFAILVLLLQAHLVWLEVVTRASRLSWTQQRVANDVFINVKKLKASLPWKSHDRENLLHFSADGPYWNWKQGKHRKAISDEKAVDLLAY